MYDGVERDVRQEEKVKNKQKREKLTGTEGKKKEHNGITKW